MVCDTCKACPHDGKPDNCKGGTWCDCHHRLPRENSSNYCQEWLPEAVTGSMQTGYLKLQEQCSYPFGQNGICINQENHMVRGAK